VEKTTQRLHTQLFFEGPSHGDIDGDKDTCRLTSPYDVHYYDGKLVVGDWSKIKMFACEAGK